MDIKKRDFLAAGLGIGAGLVASSAWILVKGADVEWRLLVVTLATAVVTYATRFNSLWSLSAAAALGLAGVLG